MTVGHADVEGECQDVRERLEVLVYQMMGVHKVRDACKVLNTDEVPSDGVAYENGEGLAHLYPRSGTGEDNV